MLAVVVVPFGNAVLSSVRASARSVESSKVITIAQNAADRVNRADKSCNYEQFAVAAATNEGWSASTVSVVQQHYVKQNGTWVWASGACANDALSTLLVQRVRITVTGDRHGMSSVIDVVKSDV